MVRAVYSVIIKKEEIVNVQVKILTYLSKKWLQIITLLNN